MLIVNYLKRDVARICKISATNDNPDIKQKHIIQAQLAFETPIISQYVFV